MISAVSLRLLYLIFQHMLGLVLLLGRRSSAKDINPDLVRGLEDERNACGTRKVFEVAGPVLTCAAENPVTVSEQHVPGRRPRHHCPDESQHDRLLWPCDSST